MQMGSRFPKAALRIKRLITVITAYNFQSVPMEDYEVRQAMNRT